MLANADVTGPKYGGGAQAPLWYFDVVGIQALTLTFPFSQAMSVTRREFFLGTLLTAAFTSSILAGSRSSAAWSNGRRRVGRERMVLRTAVDVEGRTARRAAGRLRRSDAVLRDRILAGDEFRSCSPASPTFRARHRRLLHRGMCRLRRPGRLGIRVGGRRWRCRRRRGGRDDACRCHCLPRSGARSPDRSPRMPRPARRVGASDGHTAEGCRDAQRAAPRRRFRLSRVSRAPHPDEASGAGRRSHPRSRAWPCDEVGRGASSAAGRIRRRRPSSARSRGEFIRISARLSHCESTCGWIFEGRCVDSSSHRPYLRPSAAIWTRRSARACCTGVDRLGRAQVVRLVEHDQGRGPRCSRCAQSCSITSRLTASGSAGRGTR